MHTGTHALDAFISGIGISSKLGELQSRYEMKRPTDCRSIQLRERRRDKGGREAKRKMIAVLPEPTLLVLHG